jgi:chemotaxis receptor (MCP) glutamine deamidase CheD
MLKRIHRIVRKEGRKEQEAGENVILRSIVSCVAICYYDEQIRWDGMSGTCNTHRIENKYV